MAAVPAASFFLGFAARLDPALTPDKLGCPALIHQLPGRGLGGGVFPRRFAPLLYPPPPDGMNHLAPRGPATIAPPELVAAIVTRTV